MSFIYVIIGIWYNVMHISVRSFRSDKMKNMLNFLSDEELVALKEWLSQDKKDTSAIISKNYNNW